jgi:homocysteine S-methyltransferase
MFSPKAPSTPIKVDEPARPQPTTPVEERTQFGKRLGREFLFSVEVNPKAGIDPSASIEAARMLKEAGADVINIADGPRATVRMSNLSLALSIQSQLDMEALLHVCCRDRNFLGLQSHLLGAHVLGVQNLVLITGDPPKMGDYPNATAVYDVDSIGLIGMVNGFNCGVDPAGKPMPQATRFVIATGAEPAAVDFEREILRLKQKIDNGANLVMTQPIYDPAHMERFLEATSGLDVPVMVGILPLASHKNAEFLHNHVPGMQIPQPIRDRMKAAGKGDSARAEGVKIAIEALEGLRDKVAGAYIMPPLGRYDMAAKIIEAFKDNREIAQDVPGRRG